LPTTPDAFPSVNDQPLSGDTLVELNRLWTIAKIFSNTAHDVNNALQVISGSAELLGVRDDFDATTKRRVQAIRGQAERAAEAIDRLLKYVRGARDSGVQLVDIAALVQSVIALRAFTLNRAQIAVGVESDAGVSHRARVEPNKTLQLLLNLMLLLEEAVASGAAAGITIRLVSTPSTVVVSFLGKSDAAGDVKATAVTSAADALIADSRRAIAHRIAESQQGTLAYEAAADGRTVTARLTLPAACRPTAD
jgi:hypothetical protein